MTQEYSVRTSSLHHPVIATVSRSGTVESYHRGIVYGTRPDGNVMVERGDIFTRILPRSVNKPFQAAAMLTAGLTLDNKLLALASGSHSGQPFHIEGVRTILRTAGVSSRKLQCPRDMPSDNLAAAAIIRAGQRPSRLYMTCSGKHAAMLMTCRINSWAIDTYCDPDHPLQNMIAKYIKPLTHQGTLPPKVDGCGAPLWALSPVNIASAYRELVTAQPGTSEHAVADAIRGYPDWASGTSELDQRLMAAVPGLLVKSGAEGVLAMSHPSGLAGFIKVHDGADRALGPVAIELLHVLGVTSRRLSEIIYPVTGGSRIVGYVAAAKLT